MIMLKIDRFRNVSIIETSFVTDRVRTAYYVHLSHLAESTLPMCCINVILSLHSSTAPTPPLPLARDLTHSGLPLQGGNGLAPSAQTAPLVSSFDNRPGAVNLYRAKKRTTPPTASTASGSRRSWRRSAAAACTGNQAKTSPVQQALHVRDLTRKLSDSDVTKSA